MMNIDYMISNDGFEYPDERANGELIWTDNDGTMIVVDRANKWVCTVYDGRMMSIQTYL